MVRRWDLALFWREVARIGVVQTSGKRHIIFEDKSGAIEGPAVAGKFITLKAVIDDNGGCTFAYSPDGKIYTPLGNRFSFGWANYRGTRIGLCTWNDEKESGFVDIDSFLYTYPNPAR